MLRPCSAAPSKTPALVSRLRDWQAAAVQRRLADLIRFYAILDRLEARAGGRRLLSGCTGRMQWPQRGVYFFMEEGEHQTDTGEGLRVVRVGTHALTATSQTTLWKRLSQHRGQAAGGGNHRGSIFRLLVGSTLLPGDGSCPTWGLGNNAPREVRQREAPLEQEVSQIIGAMPFLWLEIDDPPGGESLRGVIERNSIALLSNFKSDTALDAASPAWRGRRCVQCKSAGADNEKVRRSGLWNQRHVDEDYDPAFLDTFERLVDGNAAP